MGKLLRRSVSTGAAINLKIDTGRLCLYAPSTFGRAGVRQVGIVKHGGTSVVIRRCIDQGSRQLAAPGAVTPFLCCRAFPTNAQSHLLQGSRSFLDPPSHYAWCLRVTAHEEKKREVCSIIAC